MLNDFIKMTDKTTDFSAKQEQRQSQIYVVPPQADTTAEIVPIKAGFTQFEVINAIYDSKLLSQVKLTAGARLVLISLARHYNPSNDEFFPSYTCIASHTGVSKKSVERAIKELVGAGLITYRTEKVNRYRFTGRFFASVNLSVTQRQNDGSDQRQFDDQTNNHEKRKNNKTNVLNFSFSGKQPKNHDLSAIQQTEVNKISDRKSENFEQKAIESKPRPEGQNGAITQPKTACFGSFAGDDAQKRQNVARYNVPPCERKGGSSFTPSVSSTNSYLEGIRQARGEACSPMDFDFDRAKRWYESLSAPLRSTSLARKVLAKYPEILG